MWACGRMATRVWAVIDSARPWPANEPMTAALAAIRRYPVKGLAGQELPSADLVPGRGLPQDRRWAIAHAAGEFDPAAPAWLPKRHFVQLLTEQRLALLGIDYSEEPPVL